MSRKLLICVDGSECSEAAFSWYFNHMRRDGDEVHLVHAHSLADVQMPVTLVTDPICLQFTDSVSAFFQDVQQKMIEGIEEKKKMLRTYIDQLKEVGITCKSHLLTNVSHVGYEICQSAARLNPTLIIIGSRGLNTLRRTFLGSTSDYILHHSNFPVTIIKSDASKPSDESMTVDDGSVSESQKSSEHSKED